MANTYSQIYIQIVFAVKGRKCFIKEEFREDVQKYMAGIVRNKKQMLFAIYCMPDHVHLLICITPEVSLSGLVKDIKANTTRYLKQQGFVNDGFCWQEGFGAFSYSKSQMQQVVNYILNQKEHHKKKIFREEYIEFLEKFGIEYDVKYLFEFYE